MSFIAMSFIFCGAKKRVTEVSKQLIISPRTWKEIERTYDNQKTSSTWSECLTYARFTHCLQENLRVFTVVILQDMTSIFRRNTGQKIKLRQPELYKMLRLW